MRSSVLSLSLLAALSFTGPALAQDSDPVAEPPQPAAEPVPDVPGTDRDAPYAPPGSPRRMVRDSREREEASDRRRDPNGPSYIHSWVGLSFEGGGGAGRFFDDQLAGMTSPAGNWTARFTVGTRHHLAGEAAYLGSAQKITALGLDRGAALVSNGAEAALRLNLFTGVVQPYFSGGIGWRHFSVRSEVNISDVQGETDVMHIPLATGVAVRTGGFIIDGRVCFRPTYGTIAPGSNLSTWDVTGNLGFEF